MTHRHDDTSDSPRQGLRDNGAASASELREFLTRMHGKPPQEVLGLIAQSGLAKAMFLSTLITLALITAMTAVPFAMNRMSGTAAAAAKAAPGKPSGDQAKTEATTFATDLAKTAPSNPQESALSKLGVGDTKTAPKNVNPLESRADDILKGIDK